MTQMQKEVSWVLSTIGVLIISFTLFCSASVVGAGQRGVVLHWGAYEGQTITPGIHWLSPFSKTVVKMNVQTQKIEIEKSEAYSKDLQVVDIHSALNFSVDPGLVSDVFVKYTTDYEARILNPLLESSVKQTVAKYTAEELLNRRGEVQDEIQNTYQASLPKGFLVTKYVLVNEQFSDVYEKAIEAKQVAQQDAERAQNELKKVQIEAEQRVAQATAEATAIKIQAEAVTQQGGQSYVDLQAIKQWDGKLPTQMIPGATLPFINLTK